MIRRTSGFGSNEQVGELMSRQSSPVGLLLINLGSPSSPTKRDVRRYLREFLMDGRVLDIPAWRRFLLVHLLIAPLRSRRSAENYQKIWTDRGSPLLSNGLDLRDRIQELVGSEVAVELAMRYGEPSIPAALDRLRARGSDRLVVFPLYAQYSAASTGSSLEAILAALCRAPAIMPVQVVPPFYAHPAYLEAKAQLAQPILARVQPDLVLFSFHGLPVRQLRKTAPDVDCLQQPDCCSSETARRFCYRAQCLSSAALLAERLGLRGERYSVSFQSRLRGTPWIGPYTDEVLAREAERGCRRVVVISGFVADCLETLEEIAIRGREIWCHHGGESLDLVPAPNADRAWAEAVVEIAREPLLEKSCQHVAQGFRPALGIPR